MIIIIREGDKVKISDNIELVDIESLYPYHNNPKEHPTDQIEKIASSIKNYGFVQPLVIDGENEIIIGHGRLEAAKKLGLDKVPVVVKDDLTDAQIKALRIADNKVAESEWNMEQLSEELELLKMEDVEIKELGFELEEIEGIMNDIDIDEFFEEEDKNHKSKTKENEFIVCPNCGEEIEI